VGEVVLRLRDPPRSPRPAGVRSRSAGSSRPPSVLRWLRVGIATDSGRDPSHAPDHADPHAL